MMKKKKKNDGSDFIGNLYRKQVFMHKHYRFPLYFGIPIYNLPAILNIKMLQTAGLAKQIYPNDQCQGHR